MYNDELYHYGVLGMKWGVRRTPEQLGHIIERKRKDHATAKLAKKQARADRKERIRSLKESKARQRDARYNRATVKKLTDAEIRSRIERLNLEKEYRNLSKTNISKGREIAARVLESSGTKILTTVTTGVGLYAIKTAMEGGTFNTKDAATWIANPAKKK